MEEFDLVQQLKNKDEDSFRFLVQTYQKMILNSCYKFVNCKETAEDLTQEVFIQVIRSIDSFRFESKLSTWIYRIAVTKSLDHLRSKKRKSTIFGLLSIFDLSIFSNEPVGESNPLSEIENNDRAEILFTALNKLPVSQRTAFTLSNCEDLSYKEISEIMNVSVSSVESLIFRARTNLKKYLYKYYKGNSR